jgi:hypothetical protein
VSAMTSRQKAPLASTVRDAPGYASAHAIDLYLLSASEEEASPLERRRKHTRKSPSPKAGLIPSGASAAEGMILCITYFLVDRNS